MIAFFHLCDGPVVEVKIGFRVLPRARKMGHSTARDDGDAFRAICDDLRNRFSEFLAATGCRQRWQVGVHKNRDNGNLAILDDPFIHSGEGMSQNCVLRIGHVEAGVHQFVEQVFRKPLVNGKVIILAGEFRTRTFSGENGKGWDRSEEKSFHVIVANHQHHIGLGLIQVLAQQAHRGNVSIELCRIFTWRPHEKLRRVNGSHGCYDFSHDDYLIFVESSRPAYSAVAANAWDDASER